jgi:hypothetical protein
MTHRRVARWFIFETKSQFGLTLEGLTLGNGDIFYGNLEYFMYGHLGYYVTIWYFFLFWYDVQRKIWQPCFVVSPQETVIKLTRLFELNSATSMKGRASPNRHRNISIVLGCVAEKLAGPRSIAIFTRDTLDYLIANLVSDVTLLWWSKVQP